MSISLRAVAGLTCVLALGSAIAAASAKGSARVQESDGTVREYQGVVIRVIDHRAVSITSADGKGTLVVIKGACSFAGNLERCLPYRIVLEQSGRRHSIDFRRGTEYLNRTGDPQQLPFSSAHVPPHGILLSLETAHGTFVTVRGTVDGFVR